MVSIRDAKFRRVLDPPVPKRLLSKHRRLSPEAESELSLLVRQYLVDQRGSTVGDSLERTVDGVVHGRLKRHRHDVLPWLDSVMKLEGARILEIGSGHGASTFALTEQGARVLATDIDEEALRLAEQRLRLGGLETETLCVNAAEVESRLGQRRFDMVLFYASLEHMTFAERIAALRMASRATVPGGLVVVIETPNRLWYHDAHSAKLPFFHWLPDDLAFEYARFSPRSGYRDLYGGAPSPESMEHFLRRGRGVSFHEFELALGVRADAFDIAGCMQLARRAGNPLRRVAWHSSREGRFERALGRAAPSVHRAFFQPFLYLALRV